MIDLDVLHCDNHLLVVVKPAGLPCVPDESGDESLFELARDWVEVEFDKPGRAFLGTVHRLDRPVSGVLCFGRTSKGASRLSAQFREHNVRKLYLGVVLGDPGADSGMVDHYLRKDRARNRVSVLREAAEGAQRARTNWRVLERRDGRALVELAPHTGRSHQLRAACRSLGTPLVGDLKYGAPEALPDKSIALHARRLELLHPTTGDELAFEARLPRLVVWQGWSTA